MKKATFLALPNIILGVFYLLISSALLLILCTFNDKPHTSFFGLTGHFIGWTLRYLFGLSSLLIPPFFLRVSLEFLQNRKYAKLNSKLLFFLLWLFSLSLLLVLFADKWPELTPLFQKWTFKRYLGGAPAHYLFSYIPFINFELLIGKVGTFFLSLSLFSFSSFFLLDGDLSFVKKGFLFFKELFTKEKQTSPPVVRIKTASTPTPKPESLSRTHPLSLPKSPPKEVEEAPVIKRQAFPNYSFPTSSLLSEKKKVDASVLKSDLKRQAEVLEETLFSFGIEAKVGDIHSGPTITSFEVHPSIGVKVQKIKALENDIALNMEAKSIRIIAPIPGKAAVGIELPNPHPQEVSFRELFENYQGGVKKVRIPLLLGKAVNGDDIIADLVKMPHLLIAGATGAGKSVCINTIVMSIVMNSHPDEVKFLMVDPKKVELSSYTPLPHMLSPVITEPDEARGALLYLVKEMEKRYELFRVLGHRNIESFNQRKPNVELEATLEEVPKYLPYYVLIIDEFADLMMVSTSDMETPIARIAQMARAVGIHMILATQRPSREVITGLIKANFPSRIAFKVASRINSQIILDDCGAESLLGNGDMLFMPPGTSHLARAQGAFINDDDIHKVISYLKSQTPVEYLIPSFRDFKPVEELKIGEERNGSDTLYEEAKALVLETGNASTTFLQRKLKIGYARAASLMDELEQSGIIGPQEGAKPRKIFYREL